MSFTVHENQRLASRQKGKNRRSHRQVEEFVEPARRCRLLLAPGTSSFNSLMCRCPPDAASMVTSRLTTIAWRLEPRPQGSQLLGAQSGVGLDVVEERRADLVEERSESLGIGPPVACQRASLLLAAEDIHRTRQHAGVEKRRPPHGAASVFMHPGRSPSALSHHHLSSGHAAKPRAFGSATGSHAPNKLGKALSAVSVKR